MDAREALWISRAIDRTATAEDWRGLETIAVADRDVWRRLCVTLQEELRLVAGLSELLPPAPAALPARPPLAPVLPRPAAMLVAAAIVALVFWLGHATARATGGNATPPAPLPADADTRSDRLLGDYIAEGAESGRLLEQLPLHTLATRRLPDEQGIEVVFLRGLIERRRVGSAFALAADEHGRPVPLKVDLANYQPPSNY